MTPDTDEADVLTGEPTSGRDSFLFDWGLETYRQTIPRLDAGLARVITLSSALLGGSIYFVGTDLLSPFFRGAAMLAFLLSLTAALAGTQFHRETVCLDAPAEVERFKRKVIAWRDRWLWNSSALLALGLYLATLGVLLRWAGLV